jgi:hypothetical protein
MTLLRSQGTINLTHNLNSSNYWYRELQMPSELVDIDEFYNNVNTDCLSVVPKANNLFSYTLIQTYQNPNYNYNNRSNINYTLCKTQINFTNDNIFSRNVSVFSAFAFYPYNDVLNVSSGVLLSSNVDNFSVTLGVGDKISVGQYYVAPVLVSGGSGGGSGSSLPLIVPPILGSVSPSCPVGLVFNGSVCVAPLVVVQNVSVSSSVVDSVQSDASVVVDSVVHSAGVSRGGAIIVILCVVLFVLFVLSFLFGRKK